MEDADSQYRLLFRSADGDWQFGARAIFGEKGINGFQKKRFGAGDGLREFGLHSQIPQVDLLTADIVVPANSTAALERKTQFREMNDAVFQ